MFLFVCLFYCIFCHNFNADSREQKRIIERIDREKDTLLQQLDQKDEEVAELAGLKDTEVQSRFVSLSSSILFSSFFFFLLPSINLTLYRERIVSSLTTANTQADKLSDMISTKDKEIFSLNAKVLLESLFCLPSPSFRVLPSPSPLSSNNNYLG